MSKIHPQADLSVRDVPVIVTRGHVEEESTNPCLINVLDKLRILTSIPGVSGKTNLKTYYIVDLIFTAPVKIQNHVGEVRSTSLK